MPDINSGLTVGDAPPPEVDLSDPNSQEGFEAVLAQTVAGDTDDDTAVTPAVAEGLEQPGAEPPAGPKRDPETGQFVRAEETPSPTGGEPSPAVPAEEQQPGETDQDYEARLAEKDKFIGRQSTEIGELRRRLEALESERTAEPPAVETGPTEEDVDGISEMIEKHGGLRTFEWIAQNRDDLIDTTLEMWIAEDPAAAIPMATRYHTIRAQQELGVGQKQELPAVLQTTVETENLKGVMAKVAADVPNWTDVAPYIQPALEDHDMARDLATMLKSGNPVSQEAAIRFLLPAAQIKQMQAANEEPRVTPEQQKANDDAKKRTALVTGSQRVSSPAAAQPNEGEESAERVAAFKALFKETPTTDIGEGLTYGNRP